MSTADPLPDDVSARLRAWTDGDPRARARLTPIVHDELHRLADDYLKHERAGHSLQTTAPVNEGSLRVSPITVMREWKSAKAWLYRELAGPTADGQ